MRCSAKAVLLGLIVSLGLGASASRAAMGTRPLPYWASLSAGQARMRSGPGRNFPATWLYQRAGLPVQVIEIYPGWRKVRDQDGTEGWMIGNLISDQRTGMIKGGTADLRDAPNPGAKIVWRAEAGVIGRISHCGAGWCRIDVLGRQGYVDTAHLWGIEPGGTLD